MIERAFEIRHRPLWTGGVLLLLLVLALDASPGGVPALHLHTAGTAGIYNSDCPLAALAAFHGIGLPPTRVESAWIAPLVGAPALASGARPDASVVRHADPRAPPLS